MSVCHCQNLALRPEISQLWRRMNGEGNAYTSQEIAGRPKEDRDTQAHETKYSSPVDCERAAVRRIAIFQRSIQTRRVELSWWEGCAHRRVEARHPEQILAGGARHTTGPGISLGRDFRDRERHVVYVAPGWVGAQFHIRQMRRGNVVERKSTCSEDVK